MRQGLQILVVLAMLLAVNACINEGSPELSCSDRPFFGKVSVNTGLNNSQCKARCECKSYDPRPFTPEEIEALKNWELSEPIEPLVSDPYDGPQPPEPTGVCAVIIEDLSTRKYRLRSFTSREEAESSGAIVTHEGNCGTCSTLRDLAVYIESPDLGTFARRCSFLNLNNPVEKLAACLQAIGFTYPCAQAWAYNAKNTQEFCFEPCISEVLQEIFEGVKTPYNNPDGSLSDCVQCDEDLSGPVFKAVAGRTRRNSGLPSAICRLCDEVAQVRHDYPF